LGRVWLSAIALTIISMSARHAHAQFWSPAQATAQYRQGHFLNRYPLIEVYLSNPTGDPISFKRGFLNSTEIKPLTNGVVSSQWYPSQNVEPRQTILCQVCLEEHPRAGQYLELETDGERAGTGRPGIAVAVEARPARSCRAAIPERLECAMTS
jgi:hypothetical protein